VRLSTHAVRLFAAMLFLLSVVPGAHAHGDGLMVAVAIMFSPIHLVMFLCLFFLSGFKGRYGIAFGSYLIVVAVLWWLQGQSWYHPLPRAIYAWLPIPLLDLFLLSALSLVVIYLVLRSREEPIRFRLPGRPSNLALGGLVAVIGVGVWALGFAAPSFFPVIKTWGFTTQLILFLSWAFLFPLLLLAAASYVFRARFFRDSAKTE
jgi:hypothetical protein